MTKASAIVLSLLIAGVTGSASAQTRPTAMTCDYYKKEISNAITKTRRTDAVARAEAQAQAQTQAMQGGQTPAQTPYGLTPQVPAGPPARDYAAIERHRRAGDMACARRKFEEGVSEYIQAFTLLGVDPPGRPQPGQ